MRFEGFNHKESEESFEQRVVRIWEESRREVLAHLCTPGKDDEACVKEYGEKFDKVFNRVVESDSNFLDNWDERKASYTDLFILEVKGDADPESLKSAA